jgi:DNA-binding transcriptional LysR family regulator
MSQFDTTDLRVFFHVADSGGIIAASKVLGMSQPAVTKRMRNFERRCGRKMFIRTPGLRVELTEHAQRLFQERARPLVELLDAFNRDAATLPGDPIYVGATEFILNHYTVPILRLLKQRHPKMRVELIGADRRELVALLKAKKLHVAILVVDHPPSGLAWTELFKLPLVMVVPRAHPLQNVDTLLVPGPINLPLVAPARREGAWQLFKLLLEARRVEWPAAWHATSTGYVPSMVANGDGVGVCVGAKSVLDEPGIRTLPIPDIPPVTVGLARAGEATVVVNELIDRILASAQSFVSEMAKEEIALPKSATPRAVPKVGPGVTIAASPTARSSDQRPRASVRQTVGRR